MKNHKYMLAMLLSSSLLVGCQGDFLNLPSETSLSTAVYYKSQSDFEQAINGAYAPLRDLYNGTYGAWAMGEMRSDNTTYKYNPNDRGTIEAEFVKNFLDDATNGVPRSKYVIDYRIISRVNHLLEPIDAVSFDQKIKDNIKGQAYFLRALAYFDLVQYFGSVPIHLKPAKTQADTSQPLASVEDVYKQIIADAGQAVVGELHLAPVICQQGAAAVQGGVGLGPDAGQTLVRLCTLQSGQAGVQRGQCTAALGGEPGAKAVGAELRPCLAAHGADDGIGAQRFGRALCRLELHGVAAAALVQGAHGAAGAQLHMVLRKVVLQQGQHVRRLIGVRIHPARLVGAGVKPQRTEPAQRVGGIYGIQQRTKCCRVGSEIQLRCNAGVIQIATAIAGGKQLFARLRVALQHNDLCRGGTLCRRQRGCKTGGTAAQNEDVRHPDTCLSQ